MLDKLLAALMAIATPVPVDAPAPKERVSTIDLPIPYEYRGSTKIKVVFKETFWDVAESCGGQAPGWTIFGCYDPDKDVLVMPNPCYYPEAGTIGSYAHLMCHEKAHKNGWKH